MPRAHAGALLLLAGALCVIYLPDLGHGFIRDDFHWIRVGRLASFSDVPRLFVADVGFYRPVVLATFSANYALFGLHAFPYALTNFLLLGITALLIARLSAALGLTPVAGFAAAAVWCFNFHAVSMALLWISGRTALLLSLFAVLAAIAALHRRWRVAGGWCLLAMLSKEEAVMLPLLLAGWSWFSSDEAAGQRFRIRDAWPLAAALAIYVTLRLNSAAFWPGTAPDYYQFTFAPADVLRNALEYLDRSTTFAAAVTLFVLVACWCRPGLGAVERRAFQFGAAWLVAGFAITLFLPLRSDLYALTPSIGPCLACGASVQALERSRPVRIRRSLAALVMLAFLLIPVYRSRNLRWVRPADLSTRALADPSVAAQMNADDRESAFGSLMPDALALMATGAPTRSH